jgi:hypothetical protein
MLIIRRAEWTKQFKEFKQKLKNEVDKFIENWYAVKSIRYQSKEEKEKKQKFLMVQEEKKFRKKLVEINPRIIKNNKRIVIFKEQMRKASGLIKPSIMV